jgi:type VI secretion system protein ImpM
MILVPSRPPGYYGKVPARGDFVSRRLARSIVEPWDEWLQLAIHTSREQLGEAWLDLYMVAPIWRFVLGGGICGAAPLAGIMMPSVDSVGRNFPLLIAAELLVGAGLGAVAAGGGAWFENVEAMALDSLLDGFVLENLDRPTVDLDGDEAAAAAPPGPARLTPPGFCVSVETPAQAGATYCRLFGTGAATARHSLWWTAGSDRVRPVLAVADGLPDPNGFAPFLDGDWAGRGWSIGEPVAGLPDTAIAEPAATAPAWDRDE